MLEHLKVLLDVLVFSILSIVWFFLSAFLCRESEANRVMPLETSNEDQKLQKDSNTEYIDNQLLKAKSYTFNDGLRFGQQYIINGSEFKENIKVKKYRQFEVYKLTMDDEYADCSSVSIKDDTHLHLTLELVPNGFIINSNVFLTHHQWHTLYLISEDFRCCAVCNVYCDETDHMSTSEHMANMQRYKPLNKYDLSITRKINNNYHCGVCNTLFDESQNNDHFSSKTHEDKLLFAINRVSDIMFDFNIHNNNNEEKKDSYYFNAKHDFEENNYMLEEAIEEVLEHEYNYEWYDKYEDDDEYEEEYEPVQNLEFSYASMAKRPKDDIPDVLEVDLGNKKVTVKYSSYNMVIRPMPNRYYCMACKQLGHIRQRAEHCNSDAHMAKLDACAVVDQYDKYFVRQVDDKCYHCGHCNNLQLKNVMEDHIRSVHTHPTTVQALTDSPAKKIDKTKTKTNENRTRNDSTCSNSQTKNDKNGHNDIEQAVKFKIEINRASVFEGLKAANSNFDDIIICTYNSNVRISKLAFNIVCQGENDYYCGLCEINIEREYLRFHVNDVEHLARLQKTPFIQAFNVHLFRQIRDALHCGLCNELIQIMPEFIIKHKYLEKHIISLHRAVSSKNDNIVANNGANNINNGIVAKAKPIAEISKANIANNVLNAVKTNNMTTGYHIKTETAVTNKNVALNNIPLPNIVNKKVVPVNNVNNTTVNGNRVEPVTAKTNNIAATKDIITSNNKNGVNVASKDIVTSNNKNGINGHLNDEIDKIDANHQNEEFTIVKNGAKEEIEDDLDDSYIEDFDLEEYVYIKMGNSYIKITNSSYNTLVDVGDGSKYCFVCSSVVIELSKHVESRGHIDNMEKFKFVDKYNEDLLRQFYLMYHCSICNVVITRKQLNHHLSWPTHTLQTENTKISSKKRKNEIKTGTKQITVNSQKENIYLNEKETDIKIFLNISIEKEIKVEKLNKIVIFNDNVFKISFDFWHSLSENENGYKCKICQSDFEGSEFGVHVSSEWHKGNLEKIEKKYSPALIRKINDTTLNCIMCNTEVSNKKHIVSEHVLGKKHAKHYEAMLRESSVANSYADCDQDVVML